MDPERSASLEQQVGELRWRVQRLEATLSKHGIVPEPESVRPPLQQPAVAAPAPAPAPTLPSSAPMPASQPWVAASPIGGSQPQPPLFASSAAKPGEERSLESQIGSQWFNRIGILAVLIGMAWFLKFAIDNHWIGPLGRVVIGLVAGASIIAWSERFKSKGYSAFSYGLKALGSGILYLSLWAAFSLFHLVPAGVAFAAMILVTAFNAFMSWVQDSELLALYSIVGGLSTPLLLSTGENHEVTLFSYLLVLNLAVLVLVALKPWSRMLFLSFLGTAVFFAGWWFSFYADTAFAPTLFFLCCFFLLYAIAPRLIRTAKDETAQPSGWDALAQVVLPIGNAFLGFAVFYALFDWNGSEWAGPWVAVAFAAFYLLLQRLPAMGILRESPAVLSSLHLAAAIVFLTVAIPLKAHDRALTIGWLAEGAALLWAAIRVRSVLVRVLAFGCLLLGLVTLLIVNTPASTTPFFNARFGVHCVGIAVFAFAAWLASKARKEEQAGEPDEWGGIVAVATLVVNGLILLAVGHEIDAYWWALRWRGDGSLLHDYQMYAQFTYSAWFMLFGAVLLSVGFWRRSAFLRWQALVLVAVTIGKVFLVDISELSQGFRILSFLGLGALLLGVSFVYQRDWLHLREPKKLAE